MVVAVAGRPPRGDAVDQLAPVGEHDARALACAPPLAAAARFSSGRRAARRAVARPCTSRAVRSRPDRGHAELLQENAVAVGVRVRGGQQLRAVEDRVGAGQEAERLQLLRHGLAPGREAHPEPGMAMRAAATVRTNSNGSSAPVPASGVPSTWTRRLIGTLSGCWAGSRACGSARPGPPGSRPCRRCRRSRRGCRPRARGPACRAGPGRCGW